MTRPRRWMLLSLAAFAAGVLVLLILFDWNWLKGPLESQVSVALDREFKIAGDLDVDLSLAPRITMQDVRLANAPWASDQPMLQVARVEAVIDLPQLLRGEIVLPEVAVSEPSVLLETGPEGRANWQFLETEEAGPPTIPSIGKLQISDAALRYRDLGSGYSLLAELERVTGTTDGGMTLSATGELEQQALALDLNGPPLTQLEQAEPYPVALDLQLGETDLGGEFMLDLFQATPAVQATLASEQVRISDLEPLLGQEEKEEQPAADDVEAALAEVRAALESESEATGFELDQLPAISADVQYTIGHLEGADLSLRDVEAQAGLHDRLPTLALEGSGSYRGEPVMLDVQIGPVESEQRPQPPYRIDAEIQAGQTRITASGEIERPEGLQGVDVHFDARSRDATALLRELGLDVPELPELQASGRLSREGQVWQLDELEAQVGESDLAGQVSVDLSGARPFVSAKLQSDRLLVEEILPEREAQAVEAEAAELAEELVTPSGINLDALPELDVDLEFQGARVEVPELTFDRLEMDLKLRERIVIVNATGEGSFRDFKPLSFEIHAGTEDSLEDPDARYPLDLVLQSGDTLARAEGTVDQPLDYTGLDLDVTLQGPDLQALGEVLQLPLPATPPYDLAGKVTHQQEQQRWNLVALRGTIGDSDIEGDVSLELDAPRPTVVADLRSESVDFDDLGVLVGAPPDTQPGETASPEQEREAAEQAAETQVLPDKEVQIPELRAFDARVSFTGQSIQARMLPLERMTLELTLQDGVVTVQPLRVDVANGVVEAMAQLDGRGGKLAGKLEIALREIEVGQLLSAFDIEVAEIELEQEGEGALSGRAALELQGNSVAEMAASADGQILVIMDGGQINALIVEGIGLDVGEAIALILSGDEESEMVPIECLVGRFEVESGVVRTDALVLETIDSTITGSGTIDLGNETLDLTLQAHPRDPSVLSASTPVHIGGAWKAPEIDLVSEELQEKSLAALALGLVLPVIGAVLPFIEGGEEDDGETAARKCRRLLTSAEAAMPAAPPLDGTE